MSSSADYVAHRVTLKTAAFPGLDFGGGGKIVLLCHANGAVTWERQDYDGNVLEDPLAVRNVDPEPQPSDGPDYHAEHQAWTERNG